MESLDHGWIRATPTLAQSAAPLTSAQVESWRTQGFAFVDGVFSQELVLDLATDAATRFPAAGTPEAAQIADFGSSGQLNFPAQSRAFNAATLDHRLLNSIGQLLGVAATDLRLTQSDLWPKYGRTEKSISASDNDDQRIHVDYPNHTLAHPNVWQRPEAVELILYLDDVEDCGGATALVPRSGPDDPAYRWPIVDSPGIADLDYVNDRAQAEAYFAHARPALADWRRSLYAR